jgi:hypothetical protein
MSAVNQVRLGFVPDMEFYASVGAYFAEDFPQTVEAYVGVIKLNVLKGFQKKGLFQAVFCLYDAKEAKNHECFTDGCRLRIYTCERIIQYSMSGLVTNEWQ